MGRSGTAHPPLVGPGSELQLTFDGRSVPHVEVVEARALLATEGEHPPQSPPVEVSRSGVVPKTQT